jgi:hypothetical protein
MTLLYFHSLAYAAPVFPQLKAPGFGGPFYPNISLVLQGPFSTAQGQELLSPIKVKNSVTESLRLLFVDSDYVAIAEKEGSKAVLLNKVLVATIRYQ